MIKLNKSRTINEIRGRVLSDMIKKCLNQPSRNLEEVINDTIYHENLRLKDEPRTTQTKTEFRYWKQVNRRLPKADDNTKKEILSEIIRSYVEEIIGNFNPYVYEFTTKVLPIGLKGLLNTMNPTLFLTNLQKMSQFVFSPSFDKVTSFMQDMVDLKTNILIRGEIDSLRALEDKGTIILTPTHSSNLDSILVGWMLYEIGLPPFCYGAGLNLFTNPFLSFFMNNLGAYKVDRQKRHDLYKQVLKSYSCYVLEEGMHSLFFPGGTRSRSGTIEAKLKLGLMGTSLNAYFNNLIHKKEKPNIYIVPCTINYELVLEAETLIDDYLKGVGKSRYIIIDDESYQISKVANFVTNLLSLDSKIILNISRPLDPFGNTVGEDGLSYDNRGRPIDITKYLAGNGYYGLDPQRDKEYTRELGEKIVEAFFRDNVIRSTNLLAFVIFRILRKRNPHMNLFRLLRTGGTEPNIELQEILEKMDRLLEVMRDRLNRGQMTLATSLRTGNARDIYENAFNLFSCFHSQKTLARINDIVYPTNLNLLYYYHNRLTGYGLEEHIDG